MVDYTSKANVNTASLIMAKDMVKRDWHDETIEVYHTRIPTRAFWQIIIDFNGVANLTDWLEKASQEERDRLFVMHVVEGK